MPRSSSVAVAMCRYVDIPTYGSPDNSPGRVCTDSMVSCRSVCQRRDCSVSICVQHLNVCAQYMRTCAQRRMKPASWVSSQPFRSRANAGVAYRRRCRFSDVVSDWPNDVSSRSQFVTIGLSCPFQTACRQCQNQTVALLSGSRTVQGWL